MCYLHTNIYYTKKYDKSVNQISPNTYAIFMMLRSIKVLIVDLICAIFQMSKSKYIWSHNMKLCEQTDKSI